MIDKVRSTNICPLIVLSRIRLNFQDALSISAGHDGPTRMLFLNKFGDIG